MKNDKIFRLMLSRMQEVTIVPPQRLGPLTIVYKRIVPQFKFYPWKSGIIFSLFASILLYLLLGATLIKVVSILQFGF